MPCDEAFCDYGTMTGRVHPMSGQQLPTNLTAPLNGHPTFRCYDFLNNLVEQDHRAPKRRPRSMLGFKTFRCARILLGGIEVMRMIAKAQMKCARGTHLSTADQFYDLAI
ncbi:hypothetical protein LMG28727_07284 [Paraburkholderia kirstenboschensis]|nr:hypothetical protein LMG28727_07284 [Paraburkholderia kirstenboschensis]